jgi:MFS family permease
MDSGLSVMQGIINAFDMPGRQSFMVQMVEDRADLGNAIAINSSMVNVARLIGPSLAGMLIAVTSEGWCFLIDGISYMAVIASLLMMRLHVPPVMRKARRPSDELKEGWSYVGVPAHPHHPAAVCRGQPDGHAVCGADADLSRPRCCTAARIRSAS